jgi:hypothetical protein
MSRFVKLDGRLGKYAQVSEDGQEATRREPELNYNLAAVRVEPPVPTDRAYFEVLITGFTAKWSGSLKLRFCADEEAAMKRLKEDDIDCGQDPTTGAVPVTVGMRIGLYRDPESGDCLYFRDGEQFGQWIDGKASTTARWLIPIVNLYARTTAVRFVHTHIEWSPETHREFPVAFRRVVKTLLLCHRRQGVDGNLLATLPKFVLLDIIVMLGDTTNAVRMPPIPARRI